MSAQGFHRHVACICVFIGVVFASRVPASAAVTTNIFSTKFEVGEGYNSNLDLVGQNQWLGFGTGGNGLFSGYFTGQGQHAYIGLFPPEVGDDQFSIWRPINFAPSTNVPIVKFSVLMSIVDSTTTNRDDFYWSVYNSQNQRLFTVDFFNDDLGIYYALDGTNTFVWTGKTFTNEVDYTLTITLNFTQNSWVATLNGASLVTNQPITTTGAQRNLGDVDAVWVINTANPTNGDNYMVFDNYEIIAEVVPPPAPRLQLIERTPAGNVYLQLEGQSGARFAIDASTNLSTWTPLTTNNLTFYYLDTSAAALDRRYYRARWVP